MTSAVHLAVHVAALVVAGVVVGLVAAVRMCRRDRAANRRRPQPASKGGSVPVGRWKGQGGIDPARTPPPPRPRPEAIRTVSRGGRVPRLPAPNPRVVRPSVRPLPRWAWLLFVAVYGATVAAVVAWWPA